MKERNKWSDECWMLFEAVVAEERARRALGLPALTEAEIEQQREMAKQAIESLEKQKNKMVF